MFEGASSVLFVISDKDWNRFKGRRKVDVPQTVRLIRLVISLRKSSVFNHIQLLKPSMSSSSGTWIMKNTS